MKKLLKNIIFFILDILFVLIVFYVLYFEINIFIIYWQTEIFVANVLCLFIVLSLVRVGLLKYMPSKLFQKNCRKEQ